MGTPAPFDKHELWSSLDADAKADLLLDDVGQLAKRVTATGQLVNETNETIGTIQPFIDDLNNRITALGDRVARLGH